MQQESIKTIATMADNEALAFYHKQGFKLEDE